MGRVRFGPARVPSRESPEAAIELLQDRVERKVSVDITIPMRRVVAIK
jgi:hypothetical protein